MTTNDDEQSQRPRPRVRLIGVDGNAFAVLGGVLRVLREAGWTKEEREAFQAEATSRDYNHLLATVMKHLDVE